MIIVNLELSKCSFFFTWTGATFNNLSPFPATCLLKVWSSFLMQRLFYTLQSCFQFGFWMGGIFVSLILSLQLPLRDFCSSCLFSRYKDRYVSFEVSSGAAPAVGLLIFFPFLPKFPTKEWAYCASNQLVIAFLIFVLKYRMPPGSHLTWGRGPRPQTCPRGPGRRFWQCKQNTIFRLISLASISNQQ